MGLRINHNIVLDSFESGNLQRIGNMVCCIGGGIKMKNCFEVIQIVGHCHGFFYRFVHLCHHGLW